MGQEESDVYDSKATRRGVVMQRKHYGLTTDTPPTSEEVFRLMHRWYIAMTELEPSAPAGPPQYRSEPHTDATGTFWRTAVFMTYTE